jgi:hypothetical protein
MYDDDECGAICVMRFGKVKRITRTKHVPVPNFSPKIPHEVSSY